MLKLTFHNDGVASTEDCQAVLVIVSPMPYGIRPGGACRLRSASGGHLRCFGFFETSLTLRCGA